MEPPSNHPVSDDLALPGTPLSLAPVSPLIHRLCFRVGVGVYGSGLGRRRDPWNGANAYGDGHFHRCAGTRGLVFLIPVLWIATNGDGDGVGGVWSCGRDRDRGDVSLCRPSLVSRDLLRPELFRNPPTPFSCFDCKSVNRKESKNTGGGVE